ncbi:MAG: hypothetical protein J3K34DRAFT_289668 [Monoraphidium minutum]|nr:MAG: hypothetical protein J3K34DRAFT_289668 [Monoraphidium minutum]
MHDGVHVCGAGRRPSGGVLGLLVAMDAPDDCALQYPQAPAHPHLLTRRLPARPAVWGRGRGPIHGRAPARLAPLAGSSLLHLPPAAFPAATKHPSLALCARARLQHTVANGLGGTAPRTPRTHPAAPCMPSKRRPTRMAARLPLTPHSWPPRSAAPHLALAPSASPARFRARPAAAAILPAPADAARTLSTSPLAYAPPGRLAHFLSPPSPTWLSANQLLLLLLLTNYPTQAC